MTVLRQAQHERTTIDVCERISVRPEPVEGGTEGFETTSSHLVAMVKTKAVPVLNPDTMKAGEVVKKVQQGLGNPTVLRAGKQGEKFTMDTHIRCWRRYKVRPPKGSQTPWETDPKYCVYDKLHNDYGYTQEWVDFLIEELKDDAKFDAICKTVSSTPAK